MESPEGWDLLTSSLAVSNLARTDETWTFLVERGLVKDGAGEREAFASIVARIHADGPVTEPSDALRAAIALRE
jgi:hypothetical protein